MPLLECRELKKDFGGRDLFSGVNFTAEPGRKLALIGPNGCGKTSLLRIIAGLDEDYGGRILRSPELRLGYLPQRFEPEPGMKVREVLMEEVDAIRSSLRALEDEMAGKADEASGALERYGNLREAYERLGGDRAEERALRLLDGAGLGGCAERPAASLSGGESSVLGLMKALVARPNLLILDEPGNHLDLWGKDWLEDFLRKLPIALILVSHDRWLIDRVAERTLSLEGGKLVSYAGGYSNYRLERLRKAAAQGAGWQADRKKIERLEAMVKRFAEIAASRPDPAWGKRLRARRSQLEREKAVARQQPGFDRRRMDLSLADPESRSTFALAVKGYRKSYGDRALFDGGEFDLLSGEKAALVGRNGCGKTSFLRDVAGGASTDGGAIRLSPSARLGYVPQARVGLPEDLCVAEAFQALGLREDEVRKFMKRFLFEPTDLDRRVGTLSGGEYKRLQLAAAVLARPDILILDEPTNHLDIAGREAVEEALVDYEGTVLIVSHDRFLLEAVADRIVFVEARKFSAYEGGFAEFWRDAGLGEAGGIRADKGIEGRARAVSGEKTKKSPRGAPEPRPADEGLAARIEALERERSILEKSAEKAIERRDFAAGRKLAAAIESHSRLIEELYSRWCG